MKRLADKSAAVIFLLGIAICAPVRASDLLAHANDQTLWIAQVSQLPAPRTMIRFRPLGGELQWRELPRLAGRVVDMSSRGSSLAVLMETGEWLLIWPGGNSTGPALPFGAKMIAIASQGDTMYSIGLTGGSRAAATAPATSASTQTTEPTTTPAPERLTLFKFDGAAWTRVTDLPDDIPVNVTDLMLSVIDQRPMVVVPGSQQSIRVLELSPENMWADQGPVALSFTPRQIALLSVSQRPLLWVAGNSDAGVIYERRESWSAPTKLDLNRPVTNPRGRAFVFAGGNLRLLVEDENDKLHEQCYRADGQLIGEYAMLPAPRPNVPQGYNNWFALSALAAALVIMLGTSRRRPTEDEPKIGGLPLAPPALRLLGGLIDLLPIFVTITVLKLRGDMNDPATIPPLPLLIATGVYFAHTLICELAMGRSIGKIVVGLRVIGVDGKPAGAGAIIVRNLLRAIDLFPPLLVLIIFTPLRQRLGDMVASTTVVTTNPIVEDRREPEEGEEQE